MGMRVVFLAILLSFSYFFWGVLISPSIDSFKKSKEILEKYQEKECFIKYNSSSEEGCQHITLLCDDQHVFLDEEITKNFCISESSKFPKDQLKKFLLSPKNKTATFDKKSYQIWVIVKILKMVIYSIWSIILVYSIFYFCYSVVSDSAVFLERKGKRK